MQERLAGCGDVDSLDHLLECHNMGQINPGSVFDEKVSFLREMVIKTARNCPIMPVPIPPVSIRPPTEMDELSLTNTSPSTEKPEVSDNEEPSWALDFDITEIPQRDDPTDATAQQTLLVRSADRTSSQQRTSDEEWES